MAAQRYYANPLGTTRMAKSQLRSNREHKKPKQTKKPAAPAGTKTSVPFRMPPSTHGGKS